MFEEIIECIETGEQPVYDLEIDSDFHNFYAGDILVHNCSYSIISAQCLYLKAYYPAYFYANLLNVEDHEAFQDIISDALSMGVKILSPSVKHSEYRFTVEDNAIRIGLKALKGFGEIAYKELEEFDVKSKENIYEVLSLPFKKVNSAAFTTLINSGCFDVYGVTREKLATVRSLYNDPKIEKWFSRKSKALDITKMPPSLMQFNETQIFTILDKVKTLENPHIHFVTELIDLINVELKPINVKEDEEQQILGFSLSLASKLNKMLETVQLHAELDLKSINESTEYDICYWFLMNVTIQKTKRGKEYLVLEITDKQTTVKVKCWDMIKLKKGHAYVSRLKKDMYGITLINDEYLMVLE